MNQENRKGSIDSAKEQFTLFLNEKGSVFVSSKREKDKKRRNTDTWFYLGFVSQIGYEVALPIVAGALIGGYIDKHWSVYPQATLISLFIGGIISMVAFIKTIQELIHRK